MKITIYDNMRAYVEDDGLIIDFDVFGDDTIDTIITISKYVFAARDRKIHTMRVQRLDTGGGNE